MDELGVGRGPIPVLAGSKSPDELIGLASMLRVDDPQAALDVLDILSTLQLRRNDPGTSGRAGHLRALILIDLGRHRESLDAFRSARRDLLTGGLTLEAMGVDVGKATVLNLLGDFRRAHELSIKFLKLPAITEGRADESPVVSVLRAQAHVSLGRSLSSGGDQIQAIRHFDLAANLFHALGKHIEWAQIEIHRSMAYIRLGMARRALIDLDSARSTFVAANLQLSVARLASPTAEALLQLNRVSEAIDILERARPILETKHARADQARLGLVLSRTLLHSGLAHDALLEGHLAAETLADLDMEADSARARLASGAALLVLGRFREAGEDFDIAQQLFAGCGDADQQAWALLSRAWLSLESGNVERAATAAMAVIDEIDSTVSPVPSALARLILARASHEIDTARLHLNVAVGLVRTHRITQLWQATEVERSRLELMAGNIKKAANILRSSMRKRTTGSIYTQDSQLFVVESFVRFTALNQLIKTLLTLGSPAAITEAWQWSTHAKPLVTRSPIPRLNEVQPDEARGTATSEIIPANALLQLSYLFDHRDTHEFDSDEVDEIHRAFRRVLRGRMNLDPRAETLSNEVELPPIPEGPVLQFHVGLDYIFAFVIREGQVYVRRLEGTPSMTRQLLREWQVECSGHSLLNRAGMSDSQRSVRPSPILVSLYRILIAPIEDLLDDLEGSPLLLIGHRHLNEVPFGVLSAGLIDSVPLLCRFRLSFSTGLSASADEILDPEVSARPAHDRAKGVLVLAVPDVAAPEIGAEARSIAESQPEAKVYVGAAATTALLADQARGFNILHLACHGVFNSADPALSALRLGDRWITAGEIAQLDLSGTLVVLNACATARGDETVSSADGIAWAFLKAGCRGVIATNWNVDDTIAMEFALGFHHRVACGVAPIEAVQLTAVQISRTHPHASSWGAYRYISSPQTALANLGLPVNVTL